MEEQVNNLHFVDRAKHDIENNQLCSAQSRSSLANENVCHRPECQIIPSSFNINTSKFYLHGITCCKFEKNFPSFQIIITVHFVPAVLGICKPTFQTALHLMSWR